MHIAFIKTKFSQSVKLIEQTITIKVIKCKINELDGFFRKKKTDNQTYDPRPIGLLQNEKFELSDNFFKMSEDELNEWGA
jgi:hypothetical protein